MDLRPGDRVGVFEIVGALGAGGMGEVYRARDTRLGREVALKALPRSVSQDAERLARFEREARLLAALNHHGIGAIYGVEESPDGPLLVLELVPGDTLEHRIRKGPLPLKEAVSICRQIADAVAFAHASGVVHRDLKPANIKCTPQGGIKVLDFGIAKALAPEHRAPGSDEATIKVAAETIDGAIVGTPAYMSPEQARGKDVDRRADVWSLGCILFESLTGRRLFQRETVTDTLVAILGEDPDWSALPAATPPAVRALLRRCLQRDRDRRIHDMADVRIELEDAGDSPSTASNHVAPAVRPATGERALELALTGVVALLGLSVTLVLYRLVPPLAVFYEAFGLGFSLPLRIFLRTANLALWVVPVLVVVLGTAYAFTRQPWRAPARRMLLIPLALIGTVFQQAGLYLITEQAVLHLMRIADARGTALVERDIVTLQFAAGAPTQVIGIIDPKRTRDYPTTNQWAAPGEAFQPAEAYRQEGDIDAARRLYRRAQESATVFDEVLSVNLLTTKARWRAQYGLDVNWGLSVRQLRQLPTLVRAVSEQRLKALDGATTPGPR